MKPKIGTESRVMNCTVAQLYFKYRVLTKCKFHLHVIIGVDQ